jgi:hypothetical protein
MSAVSLPAGTFAQAMAPTVPGGPSAVPMPSLDPQNLPAIHPLEFWVDYETDPDKPGEYRAIEWVKWIKKGQINGATTSDKVARVQKHNRAAWSVLHPYYEAWKRNEAAPVNGTALDACPFVTREQVKVLANFHIRSAEDLAGLEDGALTRIGIPGMRAIQQKARAFLEVQKNHAIVAEAMASRDEKIARQDEELAELRRTVEQLAASTGRGRRPKPDDIAAQG